MQLVAVGLRLEELPHRLGRHLLARFRLHLLDVALQLDRFHISSGERVGEAAAEAQVAPEQHLRVDVAPNLVEIRDRFDVAIQIRHRQRRHVDADARAALLCLGRQFFLRCAHLLGQRPLDQLRFELRARVRIHQLVQRVEAVHGVVAVHHRRIVRRRDLAAREAIGQRGAADQQRLVDARCPQVAGRDHHLLSRLHQQPREADRVRLVLVRRLDQHLRRNFDAEVDDAVAVVRQDDVDQVLANVVHIALHSRQQHLAARARLGLLHVLLQVRDGGLHRFGALQHLGDDQLVRVEQPADLLHPLHQRSVDDLQRRRFRALQLQVGDEPLLRTFDDAVRQPLVERQQRDVFLHT